MINAWLLFKSYNNTASLLLLMMNPKPSSKKWLVTTIDMLLSLLMKIESRKWRQEL
jgi:hypothetical protein